MRTWHLAAETAAEREAWVTALCACGAQLSASSAEPQRPPTAAAGSAAPYLAGSERASPPPGDPADYYTQPSPAACGGAVRP